MSASRHMMAAIAIFAAGCLLATSWAAERGGAGIKSTGPDMPHASTEESPFGGPPPMKRGKKNSVICRTEPGDCTIKPSQPIGTPCSCPKQGGGAVKGVVVE